MAFSYTNTAEGGSDTTTVTAANSGAASGRAFDTVTLHSATLAYSTAQPNADSTTAYRFAGTSSSSAAQLTWNLPGSSDRICGRLDLYQATGDPDGSTWEVLRIARSFTSNDIILYQCGGQYGSLAVTEYGSGTFVNTYPSPGAVVPVGQWCRIEWDFTTTNPGSYTINVYANRTDTTPSYTFSGSRHWSASAVPTAVTFGFSAAYSSSLAYLLDNLNANDTAMPGPYVSGGGGGGGGGGSSVGPLTAPVIATGVTLPAPSKPGTGLSVPPIGAGVTLPASALKATLVVPPIGTSASLRAPTAARVRRVLADPADGAIVPRLRPMFQVGVNALDNNVATLTVQLQVDEDPGFASPTADWSTDVTVTPNPTLVQLLAPVDLPAATTLHWRARLLIDGTANSWTDSWAFSVDPDAGTATVPVVWTSVAGSAYPTLWFADPASGSPGDVITVYGQGFPDQPGDVLLGGQPMTVQQWRHVPDSGATSARTIHPARGAGTTATAVTVDCEHDEITVVVPDVPAPGGALLVRGDYP